MRSSREPDAAWVLNAIGGFAAIVGLALVLHSTRYAPIAAFLIVFGLAPIPRHYWRRLRRARRR